MQHLQIADALAQAARAMNAPRTLQESLDVIVGTAQRSMPGIDHVGISLSHRNGSIETKAGTSQLVWELDDLQYSLRQGPCYFAIRAAEPVVVLEHAGDDQRWPTYAPEAARRGLRSQLGLRLYTEEETLGGLNMYSTSSDTLDPETVHVAELFATHAALALGKIRATDQLNTAMGSRKTIGQAIGLLMERYELGEAEAFSFLSRVSQTTNIKLREIAQDLVDQAEHRHRRKSAGGNGVRAPSRPGDSGA